MASPPRSVPRQEGGEHGVQFYRGVKDEKGLELQEGKLCP